MRKLTLLMYRKTSLSILGGCKMFNLCMELHDAMQKMSYIFIFYWCMYKWVFVDCNCIFLNNNVIMIIIYAGQSIEGL